MTTFTTEDRLVDEAPYHPGYESVGLEEIKNPIMEEVKEYRIYKERHLKTSKGIIEFIKSKKC